MSRFIALTPLITTIIAVGGLLVSVNQFLAQQNKDWEQRVSEQKEKRRVQIRSDTESLLAPAGGKRPAISTALFLIDDLRGLTNGDSNETQRVTNLLVEFLKKDADFDNTLDVGLDVELLNHWPEYSNRLRQDPRVHDLILYKYFQAFRHLHDEDAQYFEALSLDPDSGYMTDRYTKEDRYQRFVVLAQGFESHLQILSQDVPDTANRKVDEFASAMHNPHLAEQRFGAFTTK